MTDNQSSIQRLGIYEMHQLLGIGAMGTVYQAYQANLKRSVAVKILPPALANEADYARRFNREAEIVAQLEHPHIVPIYDYGVQQGVSYIVMRLLTGGTLAQRFANNHNGQQASLSEIGILLKQIASALDYAHGKGVVHRDLKPANILFDDQGNAFLTDFGIAKLFTSSATSTTSGISWGTPPFMAPEQWLDQEVVPATDQYALAVTLYWLVTGTLPFEASTPYGLMNKHIHDAPPVAHRRRPDLPPLVSDVLERALQKEPTSRYPTVIALADAYEAAIHGKDSLEYPQIAAESSTRPLTGTSTAAFPNVLSRDPSTIPLPPLIIDSVSAPVPASTRQPVQSRRFVALLSILILILVGVSTVLLLPRETSVAVGTQAATLITATEASTGTPELTPLVAEEIATEGATGTLPSSVSPSPTASPTETQTASATPAQTDVASTATSSFTSAPVINNSTSTSQTGVVQPTSKPPTYAVSITVVSTSKPSTSKPPASIPPTQRPPTSKPPTAIPPTAVPPTPVVPIINTLVAPVPTIIHIP